MCQRSSQCCGLNICDREGEWKFDGICGPKRTFGNCLKDKECVNDCQKKWYKLKGNCV